VSTHPPLPLLLVRLSALGDIVHTWPLAEALGRSRRFRVAWLVEERFLPLVALHPSVETAIPMASKRWRDSLASPATWREVRGALRAIRAFAPGLALDPQGLCKSAFWATLAGVTQRLGFAASHRRERLAGVFYTATVHPPRELAHVVDLNLAFAQHLGVEASYGAHPDAAFLRPHLPPAPPEARAVLLLPASGKVGKNWPPTAFAALARILLAEGVPVTVLWGPGEQEVARAVVDAAPGARLAPPTDLLQLAAFLAQAIAVVGADTGPVHLAAAFGTPTLAVHLATDPVRNGPRGPRVAVASGAKTGARRGRAATGWQRPVGVEEVSGLLHRLLAESV
jgi:heptosyltransferase-1